MPRLVTTILAAALIAGLLLPIGAAGSHRSSGGGAYDFAVGSANNVLFDVAGPVHLRVSAHEPAPA
jgi:hypothetical protein